MSRSNLAYKETELDYEYGTSREYDRSSGLRIRTVRKAEEKKDVKPAGRSKSKAKLHKKTNLALFILATIAFFALVRGVMITEKMDRIEEKRSQLEEMVASNQKLQLEIDSALNLKNVEEVAKSRLNMARPEKSQTVYIKVAQEEGVEKTETPHAADAVNNFFGALKAYLD